MLCCPPCMKRFSCIRHKEDHLKSKKHLKTVSQQVTDKDMISLNKSSKDLASGNLLPVDLSEKKFSESESKGLDSTNALTRKTLIRCIPCKKSFSSIGGKEEHLKSKNHLKKVSQQVTDKEGGKISNKSSSILFCIPCKKRFSGIESKEEHLKSKKHLKNVSQQVTDMNKIQKS